MRCDTTDGGSGGGDGGVTSRVAYCFESNSQCTLGLTVGCVGRGGIGCCLTSGGSPGTLATPSG